MSIPTYRTNRTGAQVSDALQQMNERIPEGWAVGAADGVPVSSGSPFWHNNAKYYAEKAGEEAARAEAAVPAGTEGAVFFTVDQSDIMTEAQKAVVRKNIRAGGSNRNLLDNAYFVGGGSQLGDGHFPINQRGLTSYTNTTHIIDRWRMWANTSTVTLTASGLTFATGANSDGLFQYFPQGKIESLYGLTVTASLLLTDGTLYTATGVADADCWIATDINGGYFGYTNGYFRVNLDANKSISIKAVKLEEGTYSTLLNDVPPDFGEELRKCQRRLFRVSPIGTSSRGYAGFGSANSSKNILAFVPTPVTLAAQPTVSFSNCNAYNYVAGGSIAISSISIDSWTQNGVFLSCTPSDASQVVQYQPYVLRVASGGFLDLSCEL